MKTGAELFNEGESTQNSQKESQGEVAAGAPTISVRGGREHWVFQGQGSPVHRTDCMEQAKAFERAGERRTFFVRCETSLCDRGIHIEQRELLRIPESEKIYCPNCARGEPPRRVALWQNQCPALFRTGGLATNHAHPEWPKKTWSRVEKWTPASGLNNKPWLYLVGTTGRCKSRMLYELMKFVILGFGLNCRVMRGGEFRREAAEAWSAGEGAASKYLKNLATVDVLAWDDFGQDVLGAGLLNDLWEVIDVRHAENRPTVFTSNFAPDDKLCELLSGKNFSSLDKMRSMMRRIVDMSQVIVV